MATAEQHSSLREALTQALDNVLGKDLENDLIRIGELGTEIGFEPARPAITSTLKLFRDLRKSDLDEVPYKLLEFIHGHVQSTAALFGRIKSFSMTDPSGQHPRKVRDDLIEEIDKRYNEMFPSIAQVICYSRTKGSYIEALESQARETHTAVEVIRKDAQERLADIESTLQAARQAAGQVGVAQHAALFQEEAAKHEESSHSWLKATIGAGVVTAVWGFVTIYWFHPASNPPSTAQIIQYSVSKLIVLSALYYILVWCAKNYGAHRHNQVVNKHRQNALSTFEAFVKAAAGDADTKNAVLLQATHSIFSTQPSGYITKEVETESPNKVIEILRSVGSASKAQ